MQSTEEEALSPPELQSRINDILTASPNIAEAVSLLVKMSIMCNKIMCNKIASKLFGV